MVMCELTRRTATTNGSVPQHVMVDGLGVGDVGDIVLRDRRILSEDGLIIIVATIDSKGNLLANVEVMSRSFVYVKNRKSLLKKSEILLKMR